MAKDEAREIRYYECWGSVQDECPFRETESLVNYKGEKVSERVRVMGSSSCTCCKYYCGRGKYYKKWGTGDIWSVLCKHPKANGNCT